VVLLPYFLSAGVHVRRDLADARARLAARFPAVDFRLAEPLGRHPLLLDVVADRARSAAELSPSPHAGEGERSGAESANRPCPGA
jgi:sirohydrochlorin ferrochelatase